MARARRQRVAARPPRKQMAADIIASPWPPIALPILMAQRSRFHASPNLQTRAGEKWEGDEGAAVEVEGTWEGFRAGGGGRMVLSFSKENDRVASSSAFYVLYCILRNLFTHYMVLQRVRYWRLNRTLRILIASWYRPFKVLFPIVSRRGISMCMNPSQMNTIRLTSVPHTWSGRCSA